MYILYYSKHHKSVTFPMTGYLDWNLATQSFKVDASSPSSVTFPHLFKWSWSWLIFAKLTEASCPANIAYPDGFL